MAIINPPAPLALRQARWRLVEAFQANRSGWTGTTRIVGLSGAAYWTVEGDFVVRMGEAAVRAWRGWMLSLRGPVNSFPVRAVENAQLPNNQALIAAGAGAGTSLFLYNLPGYGPPVAGGFLVLPAGAMMTVPLPSGHQRLVILTADLIATPGGTGTATFAPELGEAPAAFAAIELQWPYGLMRLTTDPQGWDVAPGQLYQLTLKAEEAR